MTELRDIDRQKLAGIHPDLMAVIEEAAKAVEMHALEGVRSDEQAYINWGKGRTAAQLTAKGIPARYAQPNVAKVTWLSNPLNTKHRKQSDGFGHAADMFPAPYSWTDLAAFDRMAQAMFAAADKLRISIRWGADWDGDSNPRERGESDSPHFELAGARIVSAPPVAPSEPRTLRKGMEGDDVKALQAKLGITADGSFGSATEEAVRHFQRVHPELLVDGVAGKSTRALLHA